MIATAQPLALADLLTRVGARIRGRGRANCPQCKRQRSVSFDESRGLYHCHGQGCDFSGGAAKLARELGLAQRLSPAEYHELCESRERANRAARQLYERVKARRFELLGQLHGLNRLELRAHEAGPDHPATWGTLQMVYRNRPALLAELAILENCGAELIRFFTIWPEAREHMIDEVVKRGGLTDAYGRFVEVGGHERDGKTNQSRAA